jgi:ketosteroid isomerase-like protein
VRGAGGLTNPACAHHQRFWPITKNKELCAIPKRLLEDKMGDPVSPSRVQAFYQAYARRDLATVMEFLSDDVDWKFLGPVDIFPFCGHRRGKAAVLEHFRCKPAMLSQRRMEPDELVIDGNRAASFSKITVAERSSGRIITFHCAHFVMFREDKVAAMHAIADTFGVLEQLHSVEIVVGPPLMNERLSDLVPVRS